MIIIRTKKKKERKLGLYKHNQTKTLVWPIPIAPATPDKTCAFVPPLQMSRIYHLSTSKDPFA